jgi:hypothetical protein
MHVNNDNADAAKPGPIKQKFFERNPPNAGPNKLEMLWHTPTFVIWILLSLGMTISPIIAFAMGSVPPNIPSIALERNNISRLVENAKTINPVKVPICEIIRSGLRPYLSLNFPSIGPKIKVNEALVANNKPNSIFEAPNSRTNEGNNGKNNEYPNISKKIAAHKLLNSLYLLVLTVPPFCNIELFLMY